MEIISMQRKCYAIYQSVFLRCVLTLLHFFSVLLLPFVTAVFEAEMEYKADDFEE